MKITWYGHSCFQIAASGGSLVLDPYEPAYVPGLKDLELTADECLCSHQHGDHSYKAAVKLSGRPSGFGIKTLASFHDEVRGQKRGVNLMHLIEADGFRLAHLGDLGHNLAPEQQAKLQKLDVLMIPVGGYYTIAAAAARLIVDQLQPRIVLPMHYRGAGFGFAEIAAVTDFCRLFAPAMVHNYTGSTLELSRDLPQQIALLQPLQLY